MYAFLYLPILVMAVFAFNKPSAAAARRLPRVEHLRHPARPDRQHHGLERVHRLLVQRRACTIPTYIPAIVTSLQIAAVAAIISTVLGLCAALALARMRPRLRAPFDALVYLTLVVPEIVIAVASLIFFVQARNYFHALPGAGEGDHPARAGGVQRLAWRC